jgi:hypothetical protein
MCFLTSHHLHLARICDGRGFAFIDEFVITARVICLYPDSDLRKKEDS